MWRLGFKFWLEAKKEGKIVIRAFYRAADMYTYKGKIITGEQIKNNFDAAEQRDSFNPTQRKDYERWKRKK